MKSVHRMPRGCLPHPNPNSACVEPLEGRRLLSAVIVDPTFGDNGTVNRSGGGSAILSLADGKTLVGGTDENTFFAQGRLFRLNSDGSLDTSFGNGGIVAVPQADDGIVKLVTGADGAIFALATVTTHPPATPGHEDPGRETRAAVFCFHADGSPDESFGTDGMALVYHDEGDGGDFRPVTLALDGQGRVVVCGQVGGGTFDLGVADFVLARVNADGSPDDGFGQNGLAVADFHKAILDHADTPRTILIDSAGRILVGGATSQSSEDPLLDTAFALARFNADGSPDLSFGSEGKVVTAFHNADAPSIPDEEASVNDIELLPDGRILVVGGGQAGQIAAARYNADGSPDRTFGHNGTLVTGGVAGFANYSALLLDDGGWKVIGSGRGVYAGKFRIDGTLEDSASLATPENVGLACSVTPDGAIEVVGVVPQDHVQISPPALTVTKYLFKDVPTEPVTTPVPPRRVGLHASHSRSAAEGEAIGGTLAKARVAGDPSAFDGLVARTDWGDGTAPTISGLVKGTQNLNVESVAGRHVYSAPGTYALRISLMSGSTTVRAISQSVHVRPASARARAVRATAGQSFAASLGWIDNDPASKSQEVLIDWGDGLGSSEAVVLKRNAGRYAIAGRHQYAQAGTFNVSVVIESDDPLPGADIKSSTVLTSVARVSA